MIALGAPAPGTEVSLPVGGDYVLVLEWLTDQDERTGSALHKFLSRVGFQSELVTCQSWGDVERVLISAREGADIKGIPIVHLETHGENPWEGDSEIGIVCGASRDSAAAWARFGLILAPLNVRAGFRLLVVSAACWGSGIMAAIEGGDHAAPFACAVGLRTEVRPGRLLEAMRELYRRLNAGDSINESVASAQRELAADEELSIEKMVVVAAKILRKQYFQPQVTPTAGPLRRRRRCRAIWDTWFPPYLQERIPAFRFENVGLLPKLRGWRTAP